MKDDKTTDIRPANRVSEISEYYFSRKLREIEKMRQEGADIISLAIGSPDLPPSEKTIEKLCETAVRPDIHGYQPTAGIPELRKAISNFYKKRFDVKIDPDREIQPLIGSKEGILHVTLAFVNVGDKVLIPDPGYPTYSSLSKILGAKIVNYNLSESNGWQPDFESLEKEDLSNVKLMWVNYPNMPTGAPAKLETYRKLVEFGMNHNIVIVNDNPYSLILNKKPLSILQIPGAKDCCIEFNSMSKSHNMPGWRIGMAISNPEFISWILKIKSNIDSGTFRAIQLAAAEAFNNTESWHTHFNIEVYGKRRYYAEKIMETLGCVYDKNQVGMFLWGKIPDNYTEAEILTEKILKESHVFITPGFIFGKNGKRYIRISLCASEKKLEEALERIQKLEK